MIERGYWELKWSRIHKGELILVLYQPTRTDMDEMIDIVNLPEVVIHHQVKGAEYFALYLGVCHGPNPRMVEQTIHERMVAWWKREQHETSGPFAAFIETLDMRGL